MDFSDLSQDGAFYIRVWMVIMWGVVGVTFGIATCNIYSPPGPPDPAKITYDCSALNPALLTQYMDACSKSFPQKNDVGNHGYNRTARIDCNKAYPKKMCKPVTPGKAKQAP